MKKCPWKPEPPPNFNLLLTPLPSPTFAGLLKVACLCLHGSQIINFCTLKWFNSTLSPSNPAVGFYITEFTTDLRHVKGKNNAVADAFSRVQINATFYTEMDFREKAKAQAKDQETQY